MCTLRDRTRRVSVTTLYVPSRPAESSEMVFATRSDEFVQHTTDAVQSSLLRPPGSGSPLCLHRGMFTEHANEVVIKVRGSHQLSVLPLAACASSGVSEACAATLEKYRPLSTDDASRASPELTLCDSELALRTTPQLCLFSEFEEDETVLREARGNFSCSPSAEKHMRMVSSKIFVALFRQRNTCEMCQRWTVSWRLLAEVGWPLVIHLVLLKKSIAHHPTPSSPSESSGRNVMSYFTSATSAGCS